MTNAYFCQDVKMVIVRGKSLNVFANLDSREMLIINAFLTVYTTKFLTMTLIPVFVNTISTEMKMENALNIVESMKSLIMQPTHAFVIHHSLETKTLENAF